VSLHLFSKDQLKEDYNKYKSCFSLNNPEKTNKVRMVVLRSQQNGDNGKDI